MGRITALVLGVGAVLRAVFVFWAHPGMQYDFSDMHGYIEHAQRAFIPGREGIFDTFHPPGTALFFGALYRWDPTWHLAYGAQWLMNVGIMVLTWDIARRLYDERIALVAAVLVTVHYPLVHYAGFFLAENGFAFFAIACFDAFIIAWQSTNLKRVALASLIAGLAFGIATAFKNSMLGPAAALGVGVAVLALRQRRRQAWVIAVSAAVGAILLLVPLAQRCTRLHEGTFCMAAANSGANILIGHYGDAGMFYWHDTARHIEMAIGSPDAGIRGYTRPTHLPFGGYDDARNLEVATTWIKAHPGEALWLSVRNVYDLVGMPTLWPGVSALGVDWGAISQGWFWLFILAPAMVGVALGRGERECLLTLPLLGLAATVFIAVSEVRYRVPFDPLLIILAARAYGALPLRFFMLAPAPPVAPPNDDSATPA